MRGGAGEGSEGGGGGGEEGRCRGKVDTCSCLLRLRRRATTGSDVLLLRVCESPGAILLLLLLLPLLQSPAAILLLLLLPSPVLLLLLTALTALGFCHSELSLSAKVEWSNLDRNNIVI